MTEDEIDAWFAEATRKIREEAAARPRCEHDFGGWREFEDGLGGEQFCQRCGLGGMAHTLSLESEFTGEFVPAPGP